MSFKTASPNQQTKREGRKGVRIKSDIINLLRVTGNNDVPVPFFARTVDVITTSSRLNVSLEIFFDGDVEFNPSPTVVYNSIWVLHAYARGVNRVANFMHQVHPILPALAVDLPQAYEYTTGVGIARAFTLLGTPNNGPGIVIPGSWYARATWEPNVEIDDNELTAIFSDCGIRPINFTQTGNEI